MPDAEDKRAIVDHHVDDDVGLHRMHPRWRFQFRSFAGDQREFGDQVERLFQHILIALGLIGPNASTLVR
jgi:hypothetical protein